VTIASSNTAPPDGSYEKKTFTSTVECMKAEINTS
jgi:hypothetical protein